MSEVTIMLRPSGDQHGPDSFELFRVSRRGLPPITSANQSSGFPEEERMNATFFPTGLWTPDRLLPLYLATVQCLLVDKSLKKTSLDLLLVLVKKIPLPADDQLGLKQMARNIVIFLARKKRGSTM